MLAELTDATDPGLAGSVRVDVSSVVVQLALLYVAEAAGWRRCQHDGHCRCRQVSDRPASCGGVLDVLAIRDDPASCQEGIAAVLSGDARSLVLWNDPEGLSAALRAIPGGSSVIPQRAIELSLVAPRLTDRQRGTLRLLAGGRSSKGIADAMHESESTAKRDIAELLEAFDVPNRTALVTAATDLGFIRPPRVLAHV